MYTVEGRTFWSIEAAMTHVENWPNNYDVVGVWNTYGNCVAAYDCHTKEWF